jgi:putative MATE family efflux protein
MKVAQEIKSLQKQLSGTLWSVAWPVVALNLLQVFNSVLDRSFIGHLPDAAMGAHGASMSIIFLLFSLAMSVSIGAGAIVARAYGAKEVSEYRLAAQQSLRVAVYVGVCLGILAYVSTPLAANLILGPNNQESSKYLTSFLQMYSLGVPAICIIQVIAASLRSTGDTKSPMFLSGFQILVHIVLNFTFIFPSRGYLPGLGLGLAGAGLSLACSAWVAAIAYLLFVRRSTLGVQFSFALPIPSWWGRILRIAVPSAIQAALRTFSLTAFTVVLSSVPDSKAALSAMGTGFAVESLMFAPAFGLSAAAGALVGQNLGAKDPDKAAKIGWLAGFYAFMVALVICGPIFFLVPHFAGALVGHKPLIVAELINIVRWLCVTEPLFCLAMVLIGAMQGAGDTKRPFWIGMVALWFIRVPLAVTLSLPTGAALLSNGLTLPWGMALGATGAWIAMSVTQGLQGIMTAIAWRRGDWKMVKV